MLVLGIETSCDETSAAVVEDGRIVRSCVIASSQRDFASRGGVIPEDAARRQVEYILPVLTKACSDAHVTLQDIDLLAVTAYPGLLGSLLVGTATVRTIAYITAKPLIAVHHTSGHLDSVWLLKKETADVNAEEPKFPCLTLSVSGGHTDLWHRTSHLEGTLAGSTRDDAAGEAFDKGALLLGLPYPGGPALAALAEGGDERAYDFPLPLKDEDDFSFSGLKTALRRLLEKTGAPDEVERKHIAASFQLAICRHLSDKTLRAFEKHPVAEVHIVGGVSANTRLRQLLREVLPSSILLRTPTEMRYCTDNGAMIAAAGYFGAKENPSLIDRAFLTKATMHL